MAKKSAIENNKRKVKLVKALAGRRTRLKTAAADETLTAEERFEARLKLAELPRNSAPNRVRNRCEIS
jgi:small subunit ribosomal protein S14